MFRQAWPWGHLLAWGGVRSLALGTSAAPGGLSGGLGFPPGVWGAESAWRGTTCALVPSGILRAEPLGCSVNRPGVTGKPGKEVGQL